MIRIRVENDGSKRLSLFSKVCFTIVFAVVALLLIGWQQTRANDLKSCQHFETGTSFAGYQCKSDTIYIPKQ